MIIYLFIFRYDGSEFTNLNIQTEYDHTYAYFSKYEGNPFIVGDGSTYGHNVKTEILVNGGTGYESWNTLADYPFGSR